MSDAVRHVETTTRVVWTLNLPTNATEVSKAMLWARREMTEAGRVYDDTIQFESDGEKLHLCVDAQWLAASGGDKT